MRRLIESGAARGDRFLQIGLRGYWPDPETLAWMADQGMRSFEMTEVVARGLDACLSEAMEIGPRRLRRGVPLGRRRRGGPRRGARDRDTGAGRVEHPSVARRRAPHCHGGAGRRHGRGRGVASIRHRRGDGVSRQPDSAGGLVGNRLAPAGDGRCDKRGGSGGSRGWAGAGEGGRGWAAGGRWAAGRRRGDGRPAVGGRPAAGGDRRPTAGETVGTDPAPDGAPVAGGAGPPGAGPPARTARRDRPARGTEWSPEPEWPLLDPRRRRR